MQPVRERPQHHAGALALIFTLVSIFGLDRLYVETLEDVEGKPWAHHVRLISSIVMILAGLVGIWLLRHDHHRRPGPASIGERPLRTSASNYTTYREELAQYEAAIAGALIATFALTLTWLVAFLAIAGWLVCLPDEPAFLRVVSGTAVVIFALWILGFLAARHKASTRLKRQ